MGSFILNTRVIRLQYDSMKSEGGFEGRDRSPRAGDKRIINTSVVVLGESFCDRVPSTPPDQRIFNYGR